MAECSTDTVLTDSTNLYTRDPTASHFVRLYPDYINSKATKAQGRKTRLTHSVENPTAQEIRDVCQAYGFQVQIEANKKYPRNPDRDPNRIGRVVVKIKNEDGTPVNDEFDTKLKVLDLVGQRIPKLTSRQAKPGGGGSSQASAGAAAGAGVKTKKNKKK